jgi:neurobeachin-like protein 1/2
VTERAQAPVAPTPLHILYGHDDAVVSVAVNAPLDIVVSGSLDGSVIVHSLRQGRYIRSIYRDPVVTRSPAADAAESEEAKGAAPSIHFVGICVVGYLVTYSKNDSCILTYTLNGRLIANTTVAETLNALAISEDGNVIITGGTDRIINMRWCHNLEMADDGPREGLRNISRTDGSCDVSAFHSAWQDDGAQIISIASVDRISPPRRHRSRHRSGRSP